jgi:hypothetical protein|tara:strand:+ start:401 stop:1594 length:1194 start_codon:yes stop_codon:yes gene_type:complete
MKKVLYICLALIIISCGNINKENKKAVKEVNDEEINIENIFGVWEGIQEPYYLVDKFGDYVEIRGKRVLVPEAEYSFLLEENNQLSIKQRGDGSSYNYSGTYDLVNSNDNNLNLSCQAIYDKYASLDLDIEYDKKNDFIRVSTKDKTPNFNLTRKGKSIKEKLLFISSAPEAGALFMDFLRTNGETLQFVYYEDIQNDIININNYKINSSVKQKFCCDFFDEEDTEYFQLANKAVFDVTYFVSKEKNENTDFIYNIISEIKEDNTITANDFKRSHKGGAQIVQSEINTAPEADINNKDFYIIAVSIASSDTEAMDKVNSLKSEGYNSDFLWIPDYKSLSGAEYFSVFIGPFRSESECAIAVQEYRKSNPSAYGLLVSNESSKRVSITGPNKIKITKQ